MCGCYWLAFHEKVPILLGILKNCNNPLMLQGRSYERGLWFFGRLVKQSLGELICIVFLFSCFVKLRDGVKNIGLCNLYGMRDLCYYM
jgi:hypothetical protein